jgi:hypothetical protein
MLDEYNQHEQLRVYSFKIEKLDNVAFEYKKDIVEDEITDEPGTYGTPGSSYGAENGWGVSYELTDAGSIYESRVWSLRESALNASNSLHNILKKLSFQLAFVAWMLIAVYFMQKTLIEGTPSKAIVGLLMLETFLAFTALTFDDHKDFILLMVPVFTIITLMYRIFYKRKTGLKQQFQ